ncbi:MAG TPA: chloride channel protein [Bacteroidia bacterium]|nr:chloride channel protein [Bacteroidia bacterium]
MKIQFFTQFRERLKSKFDSFDNTALKLNFLNALPFWIGAIITGLISVLYATLFAFAEDAAAYIFDKADYLFFIISPLAFILAYWLVAKYSPFAGGSGIPQVTAAIELTNPKQKHKVRGLLSFRVIAIKIASSLTMIFGGAAIGREGPTIQISASIFKKINDLLPDWYPKVSKRNMIVTGAAAGLASAFNTPLGGIVFAIEELTKTHFSYFKSALLTGVIISGLTALNILGPYLYLGYPDTSNISKWLILAVIPVALIAGVAGSGMGKMILFILDKKKFIRRKAALIIYAGLCGLILAILAIYVDESAFGSGKDIMQSKLFTDNKSVEWFVPVLRIVGPVLSFVSGAAGGIFAPSLSLGASIGAYVAEFFNVTNAEINLLILCGMVAALTGITRSPFTSSILVIEMTNDHGMIFYIMITALAANLIATLVSKRSFYDHLKDKFVEAVHKNELQSKTH